MSSESWDPLYPHEVAELLADLAVPWWVAGGWALDLFLGEQTRHHVDLDILILRRDQLTVQAFLSDWDLHKTQQPGLKPWPPGEFLAEGINDVWCRPAGSPVWTWQIKFMESEEDSWLYRRAPQIRGKIDDLGLTTEAGIPIIRPEIQLLYKSVLISPEKDNRDFDAVAPRLGDRQVIWLRRSLGAVYPEGHPWIDRLR